MSVFIPALPTRFDQAIQMRVPSIDLNPAARFGELVIMSKEDDALDEAMDCIKSKIDNELTRDDYILSVGDVVLITAAMVYANDKLGFARVLQWDRKLQKYHITEVRF